VKRNAYRTIVGIYRKHVESVLAVNIGTWRISESVLDHSSSRNYLGSRVFLFPDNLGPLLGLAIRV